MKVFPLRYNAPEFKMVGLGEFLFLFRNYRVLGALLGGKMKTYKFAGVEFVPTTSAEEMAKSIINSGDPSLTRTQRIPVEAREFVSVAGEILGDTERALTIWVKEELGYPNGLKRNSLDGISPLDREKIETAFPQYKQHLIDFIK